MLQVHNEAPAPGLDTVHGIEKPEYRRLKTWLEEKIEASKKKPTADVIALVPALAQLLLARNEGNRPISQRNTDDIGSDIANKRWEFNGESIVVSRTGKLLDGQHRCQQVVATGRSIETVIVFGPRDEAKFTIDTGKSKTVSNFLAMKGKLYTSAFGPAVNYVLQYRENQKLPTMGSRQTAIMPTKSQIITAADELAGIDKSVEFTAMSMKTIKSHAILAFCHYVFWKKSSREAADSFIGKLIDGEGLRKGDPIYYCRNRILNMHRGVRPNIKAELIFKCWNAHRLGHPLDRCGLSNGKLPKVER